MWLPSSTLTTVGYGDLPAPVTGIGRWDFGCCGWCVRDRRFFDQRLLAWPRPFTPKLLSLPSLGWRAPLTRTDLSWRGCRSPARGVWHHGTVKLGQPLATARLTQTDSSSGGRHFALLEGRRGAGREYFLIARRLKYHLPFQKPPVSLRPRNPLEPPSAWRTTEPRNRDRLIQSGSAAWATESSTTATVALVRMQRQGTHRLRSPSLDRVPLPSQREPSRVLIRGPLRPWAMDPCFNGSTPHPWCSASSFRIVLNLGSFQWVTAALEGVFLTVSSLAGVISP